jgi:hypothetical protein
MLSNFPRLYPVNRMRSLIGPMAAKLIGQQKRLRSPFWWIRKSHPWSALALIGLWWLLQRDRRLVHQLRFQRTLINLNFREIEQFMADFVRPELWFLS